MRTEDVPTNHLQEQLMLAVEKHQAGDLPSAEKVYRWVLKQKPEHPDALHLLGLIAHQVGRHDEAAKFIKAAIQHAPRNPLFYNNLGLVLEAIGDAAAASNAFINAAQLKPDHIEALRHIIRLNPGYAQAHFNLGNALLQNGDHQNAARHFEQATALKPDYSEAYNNLGSIIEKYDKNPEKACKLYLKAVACNDRFKDAYNNLGVLAHNEGDITQAMAYYEKALAVDPNDADVQFKRAMLMLLQGDFENGWSAYQWRQRRAEWESFYPHHDEMPQWDGKPFHGQRLFVHGEQGYGDTLQFIRYLPRVKNLGGTVILEVKPPLRRLLQNFPGVDMLAERAANGRPSVEADCYTHLLSLPSLFGTRQDTIPHVINQLHIPPSKINHWRRAVFDAASKTGLKTGLVWAGRPTHLNDHNRSCHARYFARLKAIEGVKVFGLQKGPASEQAVKWDIDNYGESFEDFSDTAAFIRHLDLVITVDTAVAHLAGTMHKKTWLMLPFAAEWRWMLHRQDSPWYPDIRIFRQPRPGDWESVIETMAEALRAHQREFASTQCFGQGAP